VTEQQIVSRIIKTIHSLDHDTTSNPLVRIQLKTNPNELTILLFTVYTKHDSQVTRKRFMNYGSRYVKKRQSWAPNLLLAIGMVQIQRVHLYDSVHVKNYHTYQLTPITKWSIINKNRKLQETLSIIYNFHFIPNNIFCLSNKIPLLNIYMNYIDIDHTRLDIQL
jgi:hypothetical protein